MKNGLSVRDILQESTLIPLCKFKSYDYKMIYTIERFTFLQIRKHSEYFFFRVEYLYLWKMRIFTSLI